MRKPIKLDPELLRKLLHGTCYSWPDCPCGRKLNFWSQRFLHWEAQGWPDLSADDLGADIKLSLVTMFACVAEHCHDGRDRQWAMEQLSSRIFAEVAAEVRQ
jgi:hypothetical protein